MRAPSLEQHESRISIFEDQLRSVMGQQKEMLELIHQDELMISEIRHLQKNNQEDIQKIVHDAKNIKIAVEIHQERNEQEIKIIREKMLVQEANKEGKKGAFKQWHTFIFLGVALFGAVMSIYDRIAEHFLR